MAVAFVRSHGPESVKAAGTTDTYALTSLVPAGSLLVATLLHDNAASANTPFVVSISKPASETASWVFLGRATYPSAATAGAYANGEVWVIKTTVAWPNATSLTVTYSSSITMKAQNILEFSGAEANLRVTQTSGTLYSTTTTAASVSSYGTQPVIGDLAIGFLFGSNVAAAQAGSNNTTGGSWSTPIGVGSTGGNATTNNYGVAQYKVVTSTAHQPYTNSVAMTAGNGAIVAVLQATPDPVTAQTAYRMYADGPEASSAALAVQDTAPTVNIGGGDVNLGLRVRLQETGVGPVPVTDDWQLQVEKNASGAWTDVAASDAMFDGLATALSNGNMSLDGDQPGVGQSFLGNGSTLTRAGLWLARGGTPNGLISAELYAHTGTFGGSGGKATGPPLATSTNSFSAASMSTTASMHYFTFDGTFTLTQGTAYVIVVRTTNTLLIPNYTAVRYRDTTSTAHPGCLTFLYQGAWQNSATWDMAGFELYSPASVVPYDSPSLGPTGTTSRLTGGTGTFTPGKVSETGLVDNLGWPTGNHTELLYSLTLKADALAAADALRFRVLRNGVVLNSYTQTPTINVTSIAVPPVASFSASGSTVQRGNTVTFTDTSTNKPTTWAWNFGAGASPATASTKGPHTVTYNTAGTSTVALTVGNTAGSDAADPTSITVTEGAPKLETLVDTFDTTVDKTTKWSGSAAQVVWDAGRAKIPSTTAYYSLATPMAGGYRLTGSSVLAQLTLPATSATRETFMEIFRAGVTNDKLSMYVSGTTLSARRTVVGTNTAVPGSGIAYIPVLHAWWRIRESGGLVYFDYSADGLAWGNLGSIAPGWNTDDVWFGINSGYYSTGTALDAFVDNVNAPPPPEVPDGRPKVWMGSSWVKKPVKVWTGATWETKPMKVWTGSEWKLL